MVELVARRWSIAAERLILIVQLKTIKSAKIDCIIIIPQQQLHLREYFEYFIIFQRFMILKQNFILKVNRDL